MKIKAFAFSRQGVEREHNEDSYLLNPDINLFAVCDGMGGAASGEIASSLAVKAISEFVKENIKHLPSPDKVRPGNQRIKKLVEEAIIEACSEIYNYAVQHPESSGMGATASVAFIYGELLIIGHVGDSRVYLLRNGQLDLLSKDHTFTQEMVDSGAMTPEECKKSPYAHVLTRAVGAQQYVQPDLLQIELLPGDRLLICSDGLSDRILDKQTISSLLAGPIEKAPQTLVEQAVTSGSFDDSTAVVIGVESAADSASEKERVERVKLTMEVLQKIYMFEDLSTEELMRVVERCQVVYCNPGEILMHEGESGDSMFMILRGFLEISIAGKVITGLGQGNNVGEMSLLSGATRAADVHALTPVTLLELKQADFSRLISENSKLGTKLLLALSRELSARLKATNQMVKA